MDLRLKIEILHTPIMQEQISCQPHAQAGIPKRSYVNFGHPSLPIYRNPCYFTMDLRLKIEILHTPIMQSRLAANGMPKRGALSAG